MTDIRKFGPIEVTTDNTWHTLAELPTREWDRYSIRFADPIGKYITYDVAVGRIGDEHVILRNQMVREERSWTFDGYIKTFTRIAIRARYRAAGELTKIKFTAELWTAGE